MRYLDMRFYSKEKLKKELLGIIGKYLDLKEYKVFFFGSRANNKGSERSDIDVGIEGREMISLENMAKIREEISGLPILYSIDIVDFKAASDDFKKVAKQKIELLNE